MLFATTVMRTVIVAASVLAGTAATAISQCELQWQHGGAVSGVNGSVVALVPVGNAGAFYVAGDFEIAGDKFASDVAYWDGSSWHALGSGTSGSGTNGFLNSAVLMPNGDLIVAGSFTMAGNIAADNIARWDGSSWSPLAQSLNGIVSDLLVLPNGNLIAAGSFTMSGTIAVNRFAEWDGAIWQQYANASLGGTIWSMAVMPNGDLVVGGVLNGTPGTTSLQPFATWDGSSWTSPSLTGAWLVRDLLPLPTGELAMCGQFPGNERFGVWNGSSVQFEQIPRATAIHNMVLDAAGDLIAGAGTPSASPEPAVFRRSNGLWTTELSLRYGMHAVAAANGRLFVAGTALANRGPLSSVYSHDGTSWAPVGGPGNAVVNCVVGGAGHTLYAGGGFDAIEGVPANNVAFFDGNSWQAMGGGVGGSVSHIEVAPNGDVVAAGSLLSAGGTPAGRIARWNGVHWSTLGLGLPSPPVDLAIGPAGKVVALLGLGFNMAVEVFDGNAWSSVPVPAGSHDLQSVAVLPNGDVAIVGSLIGADVQSWDGTQWTELGMIESFNNTARLLVTPAGDLYYAGQASAGPSGSAVRRWNGVNWQNLGSTLSGTITAVDVLPTGQLVVGGDFTSPLIHRVAFWDGASWRELDGGTGAPYGWNPEVHDFGVNGAGEVFVASDFASMGSQVSPMLARAVSNCEATSIPFGAGCIGSNGPMSLQSLSHPWLGTDVRSRATGFSQFAIAVHVAGTNPIALPLPSGAPGCFLLVAPIVSDLHLPMQGAVETSVALPNNAALTGLSFRSQVIGLELNMQQALTALTSTNALDRTIGSY